MSVAEKGRTQLGLDIEEALIELAAMLRGDIEAVAYETGDDSAPRSPAPKLDAPGDEQ